jgi:hypothetical protein
MITFALIFITAQMANGPANRAYAVNDVTAHFTTLEECNTARAKLTNAPPWKKREDWQCVPDVS